MLFPVIISELYETVVICMEKQTAVQLPVCRLSSPETKR